MPKRNRPPVTLFEFFRCFLTETDRGAISLAGSFLDQELKAVIQVFFEVQAEKSGVIDDPDFHSCCKALLENQRAIGSFGVRADFCRAIGIIDNVTYRSLKEIGTIRNGDMHFAGEIFLDDSYVTQDIRLALEAFLSEYDDLDSNHDMPYSEQVKTLTELWGAKRASMHRARIEITVLVLSIAKNLAVASIELRQKRINTLREKVTLLKANPNPPA